MASRDNSDYTKKRTKLLDLVPEVYKSDTNRALFGNLFDRFMAKQESTHAVGYIGKGNGKTAIVNRQIAEPTVHRQAFQLQPILSSKVGSVEHMAAWDDLLKEYERLGVDPERFNEWGSLLKFNWVPPVDIDKLINFSNYYWYEEDNPSSVPQYITIRNRCTTAKSNVLFWERLITDYGSEIPITQLLSVENPENLPTFNVNSVNHLTDTVAVSGDATAELSGNQYFNIVGTASNDGIYYTTSSPTFDNVTNETSILVQTGSLSSSESSVGTVTFRRYDRLQLSGQYVRLFEPGFVFYIKETTNADLNKAFWQVLNTEYDEDTNSTIVQITSYVTDNTQGGVISLQEQLDVQVADKDCQCSGGTGWDILNWDDNPDAPVWEGDYATLIAAISNAGSPSSPGADNDLWFDTTGDKLYLYDSIIGWKSVVSNFSLLLDTIQGTSLWDYSDDCGVAAAVPSATQWTDTNFWIHKTDVLNFSSAKQATVPILEFNWGLELNEWTYAKHNWKYRSDQFNSFSETPITPSIVELQPLDLWEQDGEEILLDDRYGDLTDFFTPGVFFQADGIASSEFLYVDRSSYVETAPGEPYKTKIKLTVDVSTTSLVPGVLSTITVSTTPLRPSRTSLGDPWKNYDEHWLYAGSENTVPTGHKTVNPFLEISADAAIITDLSGDYEYATSLYAQNFTVTAASVSTFTLDDTVVTGTTRSLQERSLSGSDSIRVYVNGIRQYGTYTENTTISAFDGASYVSGITFIVGFEPIILDEVRVEVGEASIDDFGKFSVSVRTIEDDTEYGISGNEFVNFVNFKKTEQVKSETNQYPLFDLYGMDSVALNEVSNIFGYATSPDAPINPAINIRNIQDAGEKLYTFDQFVLDEDNGELKAFRDYSNKASDLWYNTITKELYFFDSLSWSKKTDMDGYYREATVSDVEPDEFERSIDGLYWVDTLNGSVYTRNTTNASWDLVTNIDIATSDSTLQTIWKKGLNDEKYIPAKVDWFERTQEEYNDEQDTFVDKRVSEITSADANVTEGAATVTATTEWLKSQVNPHSPTGVWVGDWEIPAPLKHNHLNENRKLLTSRELLTHFKTIIDGQDKIPGFNGDKSAMFHLIPADEVNYGLGGTIHEFNDSFDTALSSTFVNNVTPVSLFEFARDQYEAKIKSLEQLLVDDAINYLTNVSQDYLIDMNSAIATSVVDEYEVKNDSSLVYGDTTTYNKTLDRGLQNWIATIPYLQIIDPISPLKLTNDDLTVNQVIHHDGHRTAYMLESSISDNLISQLLATPDPRTRYPTNQDPELDTFGRSSTTSRPPNNIVEFGTEFNTDIKNREGVYWYYVPSATERILYKLAVADVSETEPASSLADGTLWMDITSGYEVLRIKEGLDWNPVEGNVVGDGKLHNGTDANDILTSSVSAWKQVSLNDILSSVVLEAETRLYENVPTTSTLRYDFDELESSNQTLYDQITNEAFLDYVTRSGIVGALLNVEYDASDAFTWNYKTSIMGQGFTIVSTDAVRNTITVQGDQVATFDPCAASSPTFSACPSQVDFHIKNSLTNDGSWSTPTSTSVDFVATYDNVDDVTIIETTGDVNEGSSGLVYTGLLPSSNNTGSESGGFWKDYYNKIYGTPYPHLEPWKLQGFTERPDWWDAEYLNDAPNDYGNRRWKYKHGFDIIGLDVTYNSFSVTGDFVNIFTTNENITVDNSGQHAGVYLIRTVAPIIAATTGVAGTATLTFSGNVILDIPVGKQIRVETSGYVLTALVTVASSTYDGMADETTIVVSEEVTTTTGFDIVGGTFYDVVTNETTIHMNVSNTISGTPEGRIAKAVGMWEQIRLGYIKPGERYPNKVLSITGMPTVDVATYNIQDPNIPTYNYFSVNIDNITISSDGGTTNFISDEVLPPYWDYVPQYTSAPAVFDQTIRSLFYHFANEISAPSADYVFGDAGPIEYDWRNSSQFLYDRMVIAYRIDPVRLITHTFGIDFVELAGLQVDSRTDRVISHNRTDFHGEILNNELFSVNGTNQWYVNYNRFTGVDLSLSDFRKLWVDWTAPLMYRMASFVDTDSISIGHRSITLTDSDYRLMSKRSPAVDDFWNDAFVVSILSIPPKYIRYDTQHEWRFEISTNAKVSRSIDYYDVHNYQFGVDPTTNICTIYTWDIKDANTFSDTVAIDGDHRNIFAADRTITIAGSTGNDGTFTISSSTYDSFTERTIVTVNEQILSTVADGTVTASYRSLPWNTGDGVFLSTTETLPLPLEGDNILGLYKYFIIVVGTNTFKLARTRGDAINDVPVDITNTGLGDHYVGEVSGSFIAIDGGRSNNNWRRYAVDKSNILTITTPSEVKGIQSFIDIVIGYDIYNYDQGWRTNDDRSHSDSDTGRLVSWQLELERFIDKIFSIRTTRESVADRFSISVDVATNEFTFEEPNNYLITGDPVIIISSNNVTPTPVVQGITYYVIRDTLETFKLALSKQAAQDGVELDITSDAGIGNIAVSNARTVRHTLPTIEVNPMRAGFWFRPEQGIVSDVIYGPTEDVRDDQLLFDQYGRPLTNKQVRVFREDKQTQVTVVSSKNDVEVGSDSSDPYNKIHLGGAHIFVDTYEHVTAFNNYNSEGLLIYDPFIGLNINKIEYDFERQIDFTQRPNMGGFYFETFFNQNASLKRNIEANVEDLRYAYDTYNVHETNNIVEQARLSLGYEGSKDYLDNLNLNDKSQFAFWRGFIQHKGSINAVNAFVNSRRFINAKVDEYWAYKLAEFGSSEEKEYPEMYVTTVDSRSNDFRMEFVSSANPISAVESTYTPIKATDESRWVNQPDRIVAFREQGQGMNFELSPFVTISLSDSNIAVTTLGSVDTFEVDGNANGSWSNTGTSTDTASQPIIRHNFASDALDIITKYYVDGHTNTTGTSTITIDNSTQITLDDQYVIDSGSLIVTVDGVVQLLDTDYFEEVTSNTFGTILTFTSSISGADIVVQFIPSILKEGTHYTQVTSNILRLLDRDILDHTNGDYDISIWGLTLGKESQDPARLIDRESETVVATIPIWDPARGHHYFNSIHNINLINNDDIALYTDSPNTTPTVGGPWGENRVGTSWLDTSNLDYIPYYDILAFPNTEDRLRLWGQLSGWATAKVYEWVKSDVPPSEYDIAAALEEGDNTILESVRKSGKARLTLFEGGVGSWVPYDDTIRYQEFDASIEGTDLLDGTYQFTITNASLITKGVTDVYVNGVLVDESVTIPGGENMIVTATAVDRVRFVEPELTRTEIDAGVEAGTLLEDYQYTTITKYDKLNAPKIEYYFWVEDKTTISQPNRTMSSKAAEAKLKVIPSSYMIVQKPLPESNIVVETNLQVTRTESTIATAAQTIFSVSLPISPNTSVIVKIDDVLVDEADYTFVSNTTTVTLTNPTSAGEEVKITYVGLYDKTVPAPKRFVQAVMRGLRGLVDADRRYTIRFTRDFTLRSNLQNWGTSELELKNLHEEWKMFREGQQFHIDRVLWNKVTESMVGYKLTDPTVRVPSLNRELYDNRYLTSTRIGLNEGQSFTNGDLAIQTILADLQNPENDFHPIDINVFFTKYSFDTNENIIETMNVIYDTFPFTHVNRMYFSVLFDAMSLNDKYEGLFKTSMIALHGVRPFNSAGIFDD